MTVQALRRRAVTGRLECSRVLPSGRNTAAILIVAPAPELTTVIEFELPLGMVADAVRS